VWKGEKGAVTGRGKKIWAGGEKTHKGVKKKKKYPKESTSYEESTGKEFEYRGGRLMVCPGLGRLN